MANRQRRVLVIGAGGQARDVRFVLDQLRTAGRPFTFAGYVVSDLAQLTDRDSRRDVVGDLSFLRAHRDRFDALALAIGSPDVRLQVVIASRKIEGIDAIPLLVKILADCGDDKLIPQIVWQNLHPLLENEGPKFLAEVKKHGHDLIVMGVSRRPGDKLFFGDTAAAVLENAPASIVFVAS